MTTRTAMKKSNKRLLLAAGCLLTLAVAAGANAQNASPFAGHKRPENAGPTIITSDKLEYDYQNYIALFDGNVDVKDPEFTLKCDRMILFFENTNQVQRVACSGHVDMVNEDIHVVCGKATYTRLNAHVLLEDDPIVTKGEGTSLQRLTGESIDVWLNDSRVVVNNGVGVEAKADSFKETQKLPK